MKHKIVTLFALLFVAFVSAVALAFAQAGNGDGQRIALN